MKQFLQRGLLTAMTAAALLAASGAMAAQTVAGVSFEDQLSVADQPLVLNGVGLRVKMIIKVYAMGLYVPRRDTSAVSVINQQGPKSVRIVLLRDVTATQLSESLVNGIADNTSSSEQAALRSRITELESTMAQVGEARKGTVIQMDYVPAQGTRISMGGKQLGRNIAGDDFFRALLRIWLGEHPADNSLKRELLGTS